METLTDKQRFLLESRSKHITRFGSQGSLDLPVEYIDSLSKFKASHLISEILRLEAFDKDLDEYPQFKDFESIKHFVNQALDEDFDPKNSDFMKGENKWTNN